MVGEVKINQHTEMRLTSLLHEKFRKQVEHEDLLINHRTTWLVAIQSFMMASFSLLYYNYFAILTSSQKSTPSIDLEGYRSIMFWLPFVAAVISGISYLSIRIAVVAIKSLKERWSNFVNLKREQMRIAQPDEALRKIEFSHLLEMLAMLSGLIDGGEDKETQIIFGITVENSYLSTFVPILFFLVWIIVEVFIVRPIKG